MTGVEAIDILATYAEALGSVGDSLARTANYQASNAMYSQAKIVRDCVFMLETQIEMEEAKQPEPSMWPATQNVQPLTYRKIGKLN